MDPIKSPDLASPRFKANPYPFYARLRAEAPVCRTRLATRQVWLVTRYDDVLMVLKDERFAKDWSARMPWVLRFVRSLNRSMLNLDPPDHTRLRDLVRDGLRGCEKLLGRAGFRGIRIRPAGPH